MRRQEDAKLEATLMWSKVKGKAVRLSMPSFEMAILLHCPNCDRRSAALGTTVPHFQPKFQCQCCCGSQCQMERWPRKNKKMGDGWYLGFHRELYWTKSTRTRTVTAGISVFRQSKLLVATGEMGL